MTIRVEKSGPVTTVIIDRPEARNAMDPVSAEALEKAFLDFDADDTASVAVLWGAGGAFCAGFDLKYAGSLAGKENPVRALDYPEDGGTPPRGPMGPTRLELDKPVIAAVNGVAAGVDHVELAVGRDYADVAPLSGVVLASAGHSLSVAVDVVPVDLAAQAG